MIRTVADFLHGLKEAEVARLDAVEVKHGPTIGAMYEGLSADLLQRAIPEELGLQIVDGFITDGLGNRSGQADCMLVRGEGKQIPYTDSYDWPVKDVIAVFEIKKTLYHEDLVDAFGKLRVVKSLDDAYKRSLWDQTGTFNIRSARRAFAETTRVVAPPIDEIGSLSPTHQLIFHTLVGEQLGPVGIVIGYHGYASEKAFRDSFIKLLTDQIDTPGNTPGSLPQLMSSGNYSLAKANGQPYSARIDDGWWPFYLSTRVNPVLLMLEYIWTRLDLEYGIGGLWGEDLELEHMNPFLLAQAAEVGGGFGWHYQPVELDEAQLASSDHLESWQPAFVTNEQFVAIMRLCEGDRVFLDDPELLGYLQHKGVAPDDFTAGLLDSGLVALAGNELELITDQCLTAVLPDGRWAAGENNTGRMMRWIAKNA